MSEHGVRKHAPYPASSAERLALCPGSKRMEDAVPPRAESIYAKRGTLAHYIMEVAFDNGEREAASAVVFCDPRMFAYAEVTIGDKEYDSIVAGVQEALDYVYEILDTYPDAQLLTEQRLHFPSLHAPDDVWGTGDILIFVPSLAWLIVADYKNGVGAVEVQGNRQLLRYGTSAVLNNVQHGVLHVRLVVIQPNAFHPHGNIRHWDLTFDEVLDWACALDAEIERSQAHDAPLVPGEKQCHYCNAATTCPALEARALSVVGSTFASVKDIPGVQLPRPQDMPVDRLAYILDAKDMLEDWLGEVEKHAFELARQGYTVPGRKLVEAQAKRRWYGDTDIVAQQLVDLMGPYKSEEDKAKALDTVMPRKLIGITDADKLVARAFKARRKKSEAKQAAEEAAQALAFLTLKESSGNVSLVPVTDARPAVNLGATQFNTVALPALP